MRLDKEIAIASFVQRYKIHSKEKKIDNAHLYAGSSMYFYCDGCTVHHATLPENYIVGPPKYCDPCQILVEHGLMDEAKKRVKDDIPRS